MILGISGIDMGMNSPQFCASCHVMNPEVMTWQVSSHNKVMCTTCHVDSGFLHPLQALVRILHRSNLTLNKTYELPLPIRTPVSDKICLECHTFQRTITPQNDINIPHAQHNGVGVQCTDCHQGTVHGRIAERNRTIDGNFEQWTPQMASAEMIPQNLRIGMKECLDCHEERKEGPVQCDGCHKKMETPTSHAIKQSWLENHGKEAVLDIQKCDECHNYTNIEGKRLTIAGGEMTRYTRGNSFCNDCHVASVSFHGESWTYDHTKLSQDLAKGCMVCHDLNQPQLWDKRPKTYCNQCHEDNLGPAFFDR